MEKEEVKEIVEGILKGKNPPKEVLREFTKTFEVEAEVFAVGKWNDDKITLEDLERIQANFGLLKEVLVPPLKLGHNSEQNLTGQSDGDPALGWVDSLRIEGGKLIALFKGVPKILKDLIEAKRYRRVSSEIFSDFKWQGKGLGLTLKAVALLGADMPAVGTLGDMKVLLTTDQAAEFAFRTFEFGPTIEVYVMDKEEEVTLKAKVAKLEAKEAEFKQYKTTMETDADKRKKDSLLTEFDTQKTSLIGMLDKQVKDGRLQPDKLQQAVLYIDEQKEGFVTGGKLGIPLDVVEALSSSPSKLFTESAAGNGEGSNENERADVTFAKAVKVYSVEKGISYSKASAIVAEIKPELFTAYNQAQEAIYNGRAN